MFCTCNLTPQVGTKIFHHVTHRVHERKALLEVSCQMKGNLSKLRVIVKDNFKTSRMALPLAHVKFLHYFLETFVALPSFSDGGLCLRKFWEFWEFLGSIPSLTVLLLHPCVLANKYSCRQEWPDHQDLKMERWSSCSNLIVVFKFTSDESVGLVSASLAFGECWEYMLLECRREGVFAFSGRSFVLFFLL